MGAESGMGWSKRKERKREVTPAEEVDAVHQEKEEQEEPLYEVAEIVDAQAGSWYRVRWAGYSEGDDTWEPAAHLQHCATFQQYLQQQQYLSQPASHHASQHAAQHSSQHSSQHAPQHLPCWLVQNQVGTILVLHKCGASRKPLGRRARKATDWSGKSIVYSLYGYSACKDSLK